MCNVFFCPILLLYLKVLERPGAFVLEIGTEEMPPHDVVEASNQVCLTPKKK